MNQWSSYSKNAFLVGLLLVVAGTTLHLACKDGSSQQRPADDVFIDAAISQYDRSSFPQQTAVMKSALQRGANVNLQSSKGVTALIYCSSYGNIEGVKLLLAYHADVTLKTWGGDTALMAAKREHYPEIVRLLQLGGAKE